MMSEHDKAMDQIRKLLRLANSTSAHEAAVATAKAQELMDRYKITTLAAALSTPTDEPIEDFGAKGAYLDDHGSQRLPSWKGRVAMVLAKANQCQVYQTHIGDGLKNLSIIGRASDVETVRYLYAFVQKEIEQLVEQHGRGCGQTWRNNFRIGCVEAIADTLKKERAALANTMRAEARVVSANALVRIDRGLAKLEEREHDVQCWVKQNLKLRAGSGSASRHNESARQAGRKAGASIRLSSAKGGLGGGRKGLGSGS